MVLCWSMLWLSQNNHFLKPLNLTAEVCVSNGLCFPPRRLMPVTRSPWLIVCCLKYCCVWWCQWYRLYYYAWWCSKMFNNSKRFSIATSIFSFFLLDAAPPTCELLPAASCSLLWVLQGLQALLCWAGSSGCIPPLMSCMRRLPLAFLEWVCFIS